MSAADVLIDQIFTIPVDMLTGFISTDLAWACAALVTILCILMAAAKIYSLMNRSAESNGTEKEVLKRKEHMEYLKEYDERENNV